MFLSPKNTVAQNSALLKATLCKKLFYSPELADVVNKTKLQNLDLDTTVMPPFDDYVAAYTEPFPFHRAYEDAKWDPIVTIHTSGSSGR